MRFYAMVFPIFLALIPTFDKYPPTQWIVKPLRGNICVIHPESTVQSSYGPHFGVMRRTPAPVTLASRCRSTGDVLVYRLRVEVSGLVAKNEMWSPSAVTRGFLFVPFVLGLKHQ